MFLHVYGNNIIRFTGVAIEEELNTVTIGGTDNVAVSEERRIAIIEGYGCKVESCVCETEEKKQRKRE
jgi:hypothetical protein